MSKYCQNGSCKKPASVQVVSPIPDIEYKDGVAVESRVRRLDLCTEDAAYFLEIRDNAKTPNNPRTKKFVENCHRS